MIKLQISLQIAIEGRLIYHIEVHTWHDIPRLSLKGGFVALNLI
jgi:hypothetical protein